MDEDILAALYGTGMQQPAHQATLTDVILTFTIGVLLITALVFGLQECLNDYIRELEQEYKSLIK